MKWFAFAILLFLVNTIRSDDVGERCEKEAVELKDTPLHDKFIKDCTSSGTWTKTKEEVDKVWDDCKLKTGYTSSDECLSMNNVHQEKMLAQYDCFDETIDPEKHLENNVYRWAVVDLTHYKSKPATLFKKYSECLEKHPVTTVNTLDFTNCYSEKVEEEEHLEMVTRDWVVPTKDQVKDAWKECESLVTPELVEMVKKGEVDEKSVEFLKCAAEKSKVIKNDCFYLERDVKINNLFSGKDNREHIKECFKKSVGDKGLDEESYFKCIWKFLVV